MKKIELDKSKVKKRICICAFSVLIFVGFLALFSANWYCRLYGDVGFESIIYSLAAGFAGVSGNLMLSWALSGLLPSLLFSAAAVYVAFFLIPYLFSKKSKVKERLVKAVSAILAVSTFVVTLFFAGYRTGLPQWTINLFNYSKLYENEYVDPEETKITFPEQKRNLVYIYLESMETSFFSREQGGGQDENAIPELYDLAKNNLNFSHNDSVGGGRDTYSSSWTIAAMLSHSAGIPLRCPVSLDAITSKEFYNGTTTINDILHQNGYNQALMVGSKSSYGGRKEFFEQHGVDKVYDLDTAYEDGIVPEGYFEWWGMEDKYLFDYAKDKIAEMSKSDGPFAFTMLTVDTHHVGGYKCTECEDEYSEQYANVLRCSSKQVSQFVSWLKTQDFYENTTIIITGDHETMDYGYIVRNTDKKYTRRIYNCFINSAAEPKNAKNREFVTMDMFPTTLAAIGCEIEGERLGLGTNLFSDKGTLVETYGFKKFDRELAKASKYYNREFD